MEFNYYTLQSALLMEECSIYYYSYIFVMPPLHVELTFEALFSYVPIAVSYCIRFNSYRTLMYLKRSALKYAKYLFQVKDQTMDYANLSLYFN